MLLGPAQSQQKGTYQVIQLHSFVGHNDAVNVVAWNPNKPLQFASGSSDRRVVLWDIERLNLNS